MNNSKLSLALLLLISIGSPSCDSKPKPTPVEQAPVEQAPVEQAPAEQAPVEQAPVEQAPVEQAPVEQAPVEQSPAEQSPAEQAPAEQAPAEQAPAEQAPAEQAPAEQAPAEQAPAEQAPAEQSPAEQAPAEEAPTEDSPRSISEQLNQLQSSMAVAMEQNDLDKAAQLAGEVRKIAAQIKEQKAPSKSPEISVEAVEVADTNPVLEQEQVEPTPEPVAEETPQPAEPSVTPSACEAQITQMVEQFEKNKAQVMTPIQKRYELAAQQLLRRVTQVGNLDAAIKFKDLIEDPEELTAVGQKASSPQEKELLRLVQQRDRETSLAVARIQKLLALQAQPLIRKATQAGDLESATKLQALIEESSPQPGLKSSSTSLSNIKESPEKDFEFSIQGDTATLTKYIGNSSKVHVPSIIQGATVTVIGPHSFTECHSIKKLVLPDTIRKIESSAFLNMNNLTDINIPESVESFRGSHHFSVPNLKKLIIPASVSEIGVIFTRFCSSLEKIQVAPANKNYTSVDGVLYDKQITTLMNIPAGLKIKNLKVPNSVTKVSLRVAVGCNQIKTIQIPKAAEIHEEAFVGAPDIMVVRY